MDHSSVYAFLSPSLVSIPQPCQAGNSSAEDSGTAQQIPRPPLTIAVADHDYSGCPPSKKPLFSSRALKTLVRPISLAQHISARSVASVTNRQTDLELEGRFVLIGNFMYFTG